MTLPPKATQMPSTTEPESLITTPNDTPRQAPLDGNEMSTLPASSGCLQQCQDTYRQRLEACLERQISRHTRRLQVRGSQTGSLLEATAYSALGGGKRVRALLTYLAADACSVAPALHHHSEQQRHAEPSASLVDSAAMAVELIHCYSLVHDDLPAMDDDDLRRGKPSCHIQYDEATAILTGDALQALAFDTLSNASEGSAEQKLGLIRVLSQSAGLTGMVGGQAIDLAAVDQTLSYSELVTMHQLKTGALISAAVQMGAICAAATATQTQALTKYAEHIGLAFQVQDDILDIEGCAEQIGKPQGADIAANKPTFPAVLGLEQAKAKAIELCANAIDALVCFDSRADSLRDLAIYIIQRKQ